MENHNSFVHHIPLFLFTSMMIFAAGITLGDAVGHVFHWGYFLPGIAGIAVAVLAFFGLVASFMHLGRKERAYRTAAGLLRSWLSIEAALAGAYTGVVILAASHLELPGAWLLPWFAMVLSVLLPLSIGMLYRLIAQKGWNKPCLILQPLVMVLLLALSRLAYQTVEDSYVIAFYVVAGIDMLFAVGAFVTRMENSKKLQHLEFPDFVSVNLPLSLVRIAAAAASLVLAVMGYFYFCIYCYGIALVLDRFLFYAFALKQTPANDLAALKEERMKAALK